MFLLVYIIAIKIQNVNVKYNNTIIFLSEVLDHFY